MRHLEPSHLRRTAAWLACLTLVLASGLVAESPTNDPPNDPTAETVEPEAAAPEAAAPEAGGLRVYVDPETGELTSTPTPEQAAALSKSLASDLDGSAEGLETFALRGGGRGVNLQGRFRNALVVRRDAGGNLVMTCAESATQAEELLAAETVPPAAPAAPEEK